MEDVNYDLMQDKVIAGACSGMAFWLYALPVDTIKTRIEADKAFMSKERQDIGLYGQIKAVIRNKESYLNLYRGLPIALMRGVPGAIITLTTYDALYDAIVAR